MLYEEGKVQLTDPVPVKQVRETMIVSGHENQDTLALGDVTQSKLHVEIRRHIVEVSVQGIDLSRVLENDAHEEHAGFDVHPGVFR